MSAYVNWQAQFNRRFGAFINPMPSENTFAEACKFVPQELRDGEEYTFPIQMGLEHGITHNDDHSAFTLNDAIDSVIKRATLNGAEIAIIGRLPYGVISKARNGVTGEKGGGSGGAYFDAFALKIEKLMEAGEHYREINLLYGPGGASTAASNIGVINANVSAADLDPGCTINLTRASWSAGLWQKMVGSKVDIYQTDGSTVRALAVLVTGVVSATCRVSLFLSGSTATPAATDIIIARGQLDVSCYGMEAICANTTTLFGIDAATYPQWRVTSYAAGGGATRLKILQLMGRLRANGVRNGGTLFVGNFVFADLAEEAAALQRFTENTSEVKRQGASVLEYKTSAGDVKVKVHDYLKQGIAFFIPNGENAPKRVGSTDLTFSLGKNQWFFNELSGKAGAEMRIYADQALVLPAPYQCAYITGLTGTGDNQPA